MKKKVIIISCFVISLLFLVVGVTLAIFDYNQIGSENIIKSGKINFSYIEPSNSYIVENALPTTDEIGITGANYFEFSISSSSTTNQDDDIGVVLPYEISIEPIIVDNGKTAFTDNQIKVYLTNVVNNNEIQVVSPTKVSDLLDSSYSGKLLLVGAHTYKNNSSPISETYRLRAWVDYNVDSSAWSIPAAYQYKFRINVNANSGSQQLPIPKATSIISGNINTVGSEVTIGDEHFYVIGDDENTSGNVKLLAKYLLNNTTNLQSESSYTGLSFADDEYWYDNKTHNNIKSGYTGVVYPYIYDENCFYYQYIEAYNDNLIDLYDIDSTARLLKYEEAVALGCNPTATQYYGSCNVDAINNNNLKWIYDYTYFTGSADGGSLIWFIKDTGQFYGQEISKFDDLGIRVVVSVAKNIF